MWLLNINYLLLIIFLNYGHIHRFSITHNSNCISYISWWWLWCNTCHISYLSIWFFNCFNNLLYIFAVKLANADCLRSCLQVAKDIIYAIVITFHILNDNVSIFCTYQSNCSLKLRITVLISNIEYIRDRTFSEFDSTNSVFCEDRILF